ncbi:unnamed protein product [Acanthoscelides obtectus]|uniref:Prefoldin subunit 5 n=1 Tax=Acanthoscelides obtectus TaxID=200917 RepID=A0A9P0LUS6_ACAOB|nr:unnamed protein product [Acanthoscelides obtectus]CAK1668589.1 Probable prefoldin subunit 5 [Acanthoscelides obtectus]
MSEISAQPRRGMQEIDLTQLSLQQIIGLKQQLEGELQLMQESMASLKVAQLRYQGSGDIMEKITPETEGQEILVPLTASMFVPGQLKDTNEVIIDVGTRYYVKKDIAGAKDYFQRKVKFVTEQMEKVQAILIEKKKISDAIMDVTEMKIAQQQQALQSQAS